MCELDVPPGQDVPVKKRDCHSATCPTSTSCDPLSDNSSPVRSWHSPVR
jgi:hypothetical protein